MNAKMIDKLLAMLMISPMINASSRCLQPDMIHQKAFEMCLDWSEIHETLMAMKIMMAKN